MERYFTDEEDILKLERLAKNIMLNFNTGMPIKVDELDAILIERMRLVYMTRPELLLKDWQLAFESIQPMDEEDAKLTLDILLKKK